MYAELCIENRAMKSADRKNAITPSEKRETVGYLVEQEQLSVRKACKIVAIPRSTYEYKAIPKDDAPVQEALTALTDKHVDIGFLQSYYRLRNRGFMWNHKRMYLVYMGSAGQKRVSSDFIKSCPFPLPPLAEQHIIVAKVNQFLEITNRLELQIAQTKTEIQDLLQAIFVETFGDGTFGGHENQRVQELGV